MSTSRRTRKQMIGKHIENADQAETHRFLQVLQRLVHMEWWSQRRGQIPAGEVLPLDLHAQGEQDQAGRRTSGLDSFEDRKE